jgi:hypothetical protein
LEGDGSLIFAQAAAGEKLFQAKAELLAMSIPPVHGKALHVDAITAHELDRV